MPGVVCRPAATSVSASEKFLAKIRPVANVVAMYRSSPESKIRRSSGRFWITWMLNPACKPQLINCQNRERRLKRDYSTNNHRECDDICYSWMGLVGCLTGWESLTSKRNSDSVYLIISLCEYGVFIVIGGGLSCDKGLPYSECLG